MAVRRAEGIYQRGDDPKRLTIMFNGPKVAGSRNQKAVTFFGTLAEAKKERARLIYEVATGKYRDPQEPADEPVRLTVGDVVRQWLTTYGEQRWEPKTFQNKEFFVRCHICNPAYGIGHFPAEELTGLHLDQFYIRLSETHKTRGRAGTLSAATVRQIHEALGAAFGWAEKKKLIRYNPAKDADAPEKPKKTPRWADEEETRDVLRLAEGTTLHLPVLLACHTGMRQGEICALKWSDIDLDAGTMTVSRSRQQVTRMIRAKLPEMRGVVRDRINEIVGVAREKGTKNGETRVLPVSPTLVSELRRIKGEQAKVRLTLGADYHAGGYVVASADGSPHAPNNLSAAFNRFAKANGLSIHFHALRHGFASLLAATGATPTEAAELLGHRRVDMTFHYTHAEDSRKRSAVNRLEAALKEPAARTGTADR